MATTELINRIHAPTLPDCAQLGGRMFICDGVNPNLVMVGNNNDLRPMGAVDAGETAATLVFGAGLTGNTTYTYGVRRVVVQESLQIRSGMRTAQTTTKFLLFDCGTTAADEPTDWDSVADGEFAITIAGKEYEVKGINFSATHGNGAVDEMDDVAARVQVALREAADGTEIVVWDPTDAAFLLKSVTGAITAVGTVDGGSGTDISVAGYLNGVGGSQIHEHRFEGGKTVAHEATDWNDIADGAFAIEIGGTPYGPSGIDLSATHADGAVADMVEVATRLQTALRTATSGSEHVEWDGALKRFVFRSQTGAVGAPTTPASGTDLSVSTLLNGPGGKSVSGECQAEILLTAYEQALPDWCDVYYEIWRSKAENSALLYRLAVLDEAQRDALPDDIYTDALPDEDLDEDAQGTFDASEAAVLGTVPPVRYVRAWKGSLIMGGSYAYRLGSVAGVAGTKTVVLAAPGETTADDRGGYLAIVDEPQTFIIMAVDPATGTYTLDKSLTLDHTASEFVRFRDFDTLYITQALPGNIELYDTATGAVYSNAGDNDPISGLAVNGGWGYVLRRHRVEMLDGSPAAAVLNDHPAAPPGCHGHATIADRYCPAVLYYAGQAGVVMLSGSSAKLVSDPIEGLLETRVDHSMDDYAHAVYDPRTRLYWLWVFETDWETRLGIRVPDLALIYDLRRDDWYVARLPASGSGLWRRADGELVAVIGVGGGVAYLDTGQADGEAHGGTVTEADADSLTDAAAGFPGTGVGLAGTTLVVYHAAGTVQERLIRHNTPTMLFPYVPFDPVPAAGDQYRVGHIVWSVEFEDIGLDTGSFERADSITSVAVLHDPMPEGETVTATMARIAWVGERGEGAMTRDEDWSTEHVTRFAGKNTGLRAAGYRLTLAGRCAPAAIRAVALETMESSK
jgi:hypothetical protein